MLDLGHIHNRGIWKLGRILGPIFNPPGFFSLAEKKK